MMDISNYLLTTVRIAGRDVVATYCTYGAPSLCAALFNLRLLSSLRLIVRIQLVVKDHPLREED